MEYFTHLKEKFPLYILSGITAGILIFTVGILVRYNSHLDARLENASRMALNKEKIIQQVREIDALTGSIENEFDLDMADINPDALIFGALDKIKKNLRDSTIKVSNFEGLGKGETLNVEIRLPVKNYSMLVNYFQYLESFRIPKFKISNFTLRKGKQGEMTLSINGSFIMPSL